MHTDRISSEALVRVGLPTALAPTRASRIRFETAVGATERTKRQSLTCIGRDHRMHEADRGCIVLTTPRDPITAEAANQIVTYSGAPPTCYRGTGSGQIRARNVVSSPPGRLFQ